MKTRWWHADTHLIGWGGTFSLIVFIPVSTPEAVRAHWPASHHPHLHGRDVRMLRHWRKPTLSASSHDCSNCNHKMHSRLAIFKLHQRAKTMACAIFTLHA